MPELVRIQQSSPALKKRLRVAAYARVSMECETLKHSLAAQISHFSEYIQSNPDWAFAGIYADDFVSGTSTKHRDEFNRMMADCDAGRIDLILVKSISRFARDTVDTLESIRHLKKLGIAVIFEREKINSLTDEGELMLTLLASFAQAESESISQNVKWGIRKRFAQGIPCGHKAPFGYQWDGDMFHIIPERADAIKEIYSRYLGGESAYSIAKSMAAKGVKGQAGKPIEQSAVKEILSNRAYTGTVYLQKYFISEKHKRNVNHGELPMYAVDGLFELLISEADFEAVQDIRAKRAAAVPKAEITAFSGVIRCGNCGAPVSRRNQEGKKRWVCSTRERKGMKACDCRPIMEQELMQLTASILKDDTFDSEHVKRDIEQIILNGDGLEFRFRNGRSKRVLRIYDGSRGHNAFANKIWFGDIKCIRANRKYGKAWRPSVSTSMKTLMEKELFRACAEILGKNYQPVVVQSIDRICVSDTQLDFIFKDGRIKEWQRV